MARLKLEQLAGFGTFWSIEISSDTQLKNEFLKPGTTTTIRAPRQTGKSSLLVRGVSFAREHGVRNVSLDLQRIDSDRLASPDMFLHDLAEFIVRKLRLDVNVGQARYRHGHLDRTLSPHRRCQPVTLQRGTQIIPGGFQRSPGA